MFQSAFAPSKPPGPRWAPSHCRLGTHRRKFQLEIPARNDGSHVVMVTESTHLAMVLFCALSTHSSPRPPARRSFSHPLLTRGGGLPAMTSPETELTLWPAHLAVDTLSGWGGVCHPGRRFGTSAPGREREGRKGWRPGLEGGTCIHKAERLYRKEPEKRSRSQRGKMHSTCALTLNGFQSWKLFGGNYKNVQCAL